MGEILFYFCYTFSALDVASVPLSAANVYDKRIQTYTTSVYSITHIRAEVNGRLQQRAKYHSQKRRLKRSDDYDTQQG